MSDNVEKRFETDIHTYIHTYTYIHIHTYIHTSTTHSALVSFMQVSDDRFQADSRWHCSAILNNYCIWLIIIKKFITRHGHVSIKFLTITIRARCSEIR